MFVAIELPVSTLDALERAIAPLRDAAPELSWSGPHNRHVTLKFLGDVEPERTDGLTAMIDGVGRSHRPFSVHLSQIGAFPNFRRARVIWLGVEPEPRLELLQHDLEVGAAGLGYEVEGRPFRPHATLARVRTALEIEPIRRLARAARRIDFTAAVDVVELTLFESTLAPSGARYRRMHAATLGGR